MSISPSMTDLQCEARGPLTLNFDPCTLNPEP